MFAHPGVLTKRLTWRNPYRLESMSLLFHLHRAGFSASDRLSKRLLRYPLFRFFPVAYGGGLPGHVCLSVEAGGERKAISLATRNLQFASLYMPQHAAGYEPETAALLDILVAQDGVFYDVGSNWGYYAVWLAGRPGFTGKVHAFEPEPSNFADLRSAVAQAGLGSRVTCHELGLSDRSGEGRIMVQDGMHGGCASLSDEGSGEVRLSKLDDLEFEPPTVIKLDVEDHEAQALSGGSATLGRSRPYVVFESRNHAEKPEVTLGPFKVLASLGYRFFNPSWAVRSSGETAFVQSVPLRDGAGLELALVPFTPEQRFLLGSQVNAFACHSSRLNELCSLFPG